MNSLLSSIKLSVPDKIYLKDPESSALGKRIVEKSIILMDDIGFDNSISSLVLAISKVLSAFKIIDSEEGKKRIKILNSE